ncbi:MAG TPA: translation initiation factor [Chitinophagaceae bacterium]
MGKKNKPDSRGFVYSTDPEFRFQGDDIPKATLPPGEQPLRVRLETKHRAGKAVTLVLGFTGSEDDLEQLGKSLKNFCGTGGSAKDTEVVIQGDQRDKVLQWLLKNGYNDSKKI